MQFEHKRVKILDDRTISELRLDGKLICYVLEDKFREVFGKPVSEWKVKSKTAIPCGRYKLTLENSPRFGKDTMTLNEVEGFENIRVHAGNTDRDTEGCPLLGMMIDYNNNLRESRNAVQKVKNLCFSALAKGEEIYWNIT